jgi:hypothetical protein
VIAHEIVTEKYLGLLSISMPEFHPTVEGQQDSNMIIRSKSSFRFIGSFTVAEGTHKWTPGRHGCSYGKAIVINPE